MITDFATIGTASATGVKTYNGAVGIDPQRKPQKSILAYCQEKGYATALLATSSILDATTASFYDNIK